MMLRPICLTLYAFMHCCHATIGRDLVPYLKKLNGVKPQNNVKTLKTSMCFPNHEKPYCLGKWLSDGVFVERKRIIPGFDRLLFCINPGPCPNLSDLVCLKCITKSPQIFSADGLQRCLELYCVKIQAAPFFHEQMVCQKKSVNSHSTRCSQTLRFGHVLFWSDLRLLSTEQIPCTHRFWKYIFQCSKHPRAEVTFLS